jgi:hypothetical protein
VRLPLFERKDKPAQLLCGRPDAIFAALFEQGEMSLGPMPT